MAADGSIVIDTKIDDSNLKKDLKTISGSIKTAMKGIQKATTLAIGSITALGGAFGVASVKFAKATDRIDKMSQRLTLSRKAFQEWDFILSQSGVSIDSLQMSMKTLTQEIQRDSDAFKTLGVSAKDAEGNFRNQEEVFKDTIIALQQMEAGIEKSSLAQKLFGRNGQELLPLLNAQAGSVEELTQKANDLGLILSDEVVDAGVLLTDQMDQMKRSIGNVLTVAFLPLATVANDLIKDFVDWAIANKGVEKSIEAVGFAINTLKKIWVTVVGVFKTGVISIVEFFKVTAINIESVFTGIVSFAEMTITKLISAFSSASLAIKTSFVLTFNTIKVAVIELTQVIIDRLLAGVQKLLDLFAKLPIVGDMFANLSSNVGDLRNGLEEIKNEAINSNKELSQLAKEQRAEFVETEKARIKSLENERLAKIKALEESKRITKEEADAERKAIEKVTQERLQALELVNEETKKSVSERTNFIESAGTMLVDNYSTSISYGIPSIKKVFEDMKDMILKSLQDITTGSIGQILKKTAFFIGDVFVKSLSTAVTYARRFSSMFFEAISYLSDFSTTTILENLDSTLKSLENFFFEGGQLYSISNMFNAGISWIQDFVDGLQQNQESIFTEMGNIFTSLSNQISENTELFYAIGQIIGEMLAVIFENLPLFIQSGLSLISSIAGGILENINVIIDSAITVVTSIIGYIADNLPEFLQAGFDILMQIVNGILDNMDNIIDSAASIIVSIIEFIGENISELIAVGLQIILAIADGVRDNIGEIITAVIGIIPDLVVAIIENLPDIVAAFIQMVPLLVLALIEATPDILEAIANLVVEMIEGFGDFIASGPEIMAKFFDGMKDGIVDGAKGVVDFFEDVFSGGTPQSPGGGTVPISPTIPTMPGGGSGPINPTSPTLPTLGFNSIVGGLAGGMSQPSVLSQSATPIVLNANMTGSVQVDGREIGRVSYQYVDEFVGGSYGS